MADADASDRFVAALTDLVSVADEVTVEDAINDIDNGTLEVFWRDWPQLSDWAGELWRRLNDDLAGPATPAVDADIDETGDGD